MKKFEYPKFEMEKLEIMDIITTSSEEVGENDTPIT